MFVVIFRATVSATNQEHKEYSETAERLRELALSQFGCLEFISTMNGDQELALSWWPDESSIQRWKAESDHLMAQKLGREKWYKNYQVEITEVRRSYSSSNQ